ncbi:MAG TPA: DUF4129 domain-containing protein [Frankiaceae bacterium]|nr:DUF4129 domain-containing protein [Frankiaceae bacterium]
MLPFLQDPVTRDGAREEAERELRKSIYHVRDEPPVQRFINWLLERLDDAFEAAINVTPGGLPSLVVLAVVIVAIVVALRLGLGPTGLRDALTDRRKGAAATSAAEYRAEAERLAAAGDFKEAVRARFRAVIRELEERAVLDPRPGRTAGEIAREGSAAVPGIAVDLRDAATTFDQVWYGRRDATDADYARVREADDRIRNARLTTVAT